MKRMASLQLIIAKILARAGSQQVNLSRCGYKRVAIFTWSIVPVQFCRSTYQCLFAGKSYLPQLDLLLGFYSEVVGYTSQ